MAERTPEASVVKKNSEPTSPLQNVRPEQNQIPAQTGLDGPRERTIEQAGEVPIQKGGETYDEAVPVTGLNPYPEDSMPVEREASSLRLPYTRLSRTGRARGPVLGVEESETLDDLAIVSTILAALKFQYIRAHPAQKQGTSTRRHILFERMDLRRYRRGETAELIVLLLLDYTSVREHEKAIWQQALEPYLRTAYRERASISIIQVGTANGGSGLASDRTISFRNELQARIINADSVLVPAISSALEAERGRASPLAHGLKLAYDRLQHLLQHGRSTARQGLLVVMSDGRGNIPLAASLRGQLEGPVAQEGVQDAQEIARQIGAMQHVEVVLLQPDSRGYRSLPQLLAKALGARIEPIEHRSISQPQLLERERAGGW
jgi:magnesium chelatase subunit D